MTLRELLRENADGIVARWVDAALATYPEDSCAAFGRLKDPFANPVGHALRVGTQAAFEGLLQGAEPDEICSHLEEAVRIRAVQQFTAAQALSFVVLLKDAVRDELGNRLDTAGLAADLREFERQIDRVVLCAFDVYVGCRERVCELRVNEVKRSVAMLLERMNRSGSSSQPDADRFEQRAAESAEAPRGDGQ
jgi:hypothetical protein